MTVKEQATVLGVKEVGENMYVLAFESHAIGETIAPGQFVNIKPDGGIDPLLRRPFSVYGVDGSRVEILFNVIGKGTGSLRRKQTGDKVDVLGPLGNGFRIDGNFDTAMLIAGGLGVAPMPGLSKALRAAGKRVVPLLGARSAGQILTAHLDNVHIATDDGSTGYRGTVIDLAANVADALKGERIKIFACGPTPMLRALDGFVRARNVPCDVSLEGPMGCGFGICQGCPVRLAGETKSFALMCKDGPVFDIRGVVI